MNQDYIYVRPGCLPKPVSDIKVKLGERKIVGKSVLNVMAAGVKRGSTVVVECNGPDEEEALKAVVEAISNGLGEGPEGSEPLFT